MATAGNRLAHYGRRFLELSRHGVNLVREEGPGVTMRRGCGWALYALGWAPPASPPPARPALPAALAAWEGVANARLNSFLISGARLALPASDAPAVSVVVSAGGHPALTLGCLESLAAGSLPPCEVFLTEDAGAAGRDLLSRVDGARRVPDRGRAAREARGEFLLFLAGDAQLLGASVTAALAAAGPDVGAVGGKALRPDGTLLEAGRIARADGVPSGYGAGEDPFGDPFMFRRDVDACSRGFLLTPRDAFLALGGFDDEADYCARLWARGLRVVYEPNVNVLRFEPAEEASPSSNGRPHDARTLLDARARPGAKPRVLFVEDRVPYPYLGQGYPRSQPMVQALAAAGHAVTLFPIYEHKEDWAEVRRFLDPRVEVMASWSAPRLRQFLGERAGYYDVIVVSRPPNMAAFRDAWPADAWGGAAAVVYDAEALWCLRDVARRRLAGEAVPEEEVRALADAEVALAEGCDAVWAVSEAEARRFRAAGCDDVTVLTHVAAPRPTPAPFAGRRDFLFVGAIPLLECPNGDGVLWFADKVFPRLREALGDVRFVVAGSDFLRETGALDRPGVEVTGRVEDLTPLYNRARVFVIPTRYAAGVPLKAIEVAAHGLPMAVTPLMAEQLGWRPGEHLVVGGTAAELVACCVQLYSDEALWGRLRAGALDLVAREYGPAEYAARVVAAVERAFRKAEARRKAEGTRR